MKMQRDQAFYEVYQEADYRVCDGQILFGILSEPRRLWRRYLIEHPPFFYFVLQERLKLYKNPFA